MIDLNILGQRAQRASRRLAVLRAPEKNRALIAMAEAVQAAQEDILAAGDLRLDTAAHTVTVSSQPVRLTKTEYAILKLLLRNPTQVIAKSVMLDRIAADTPDCTESSLKTHISHLRGKLRAATGKEYIEAVWGIGFRMMPGY